MRECANANQCLSKKPLTTLRPPQLKNPARPSSTPTAHATDTLQTPSNLLPRPPRRRAPRSEKEPRMEDFATALETFEQEQAQTEAALNDEQIVTGTVLKITAAVRCGRHRLQVRRRGPASRNSPTTKATSPCNAGEEIRRDARAGPHRRRLHQPLAPEGPAPAGMGRDREGLQRQGAGQGARHRPHQGRPDGRHPGRARVPAGLAGRSAPGAQPRWAEGHRDRSPHHQAEQEARQHRGLAQAVAGRRAGRKARQDAGADARRRHPDRHGEEPDRLRRVCRPGRHRRPAAHHRHVVGTAHASARPGAGGRPDPGEGAEVRQREAAGFAGLQAAHARSLAGRHGALSRSART